MHYFSKLKGLTTRCEGVNSWTSPKLAGEFEDTHKQDDREFYAMGQYYSLVNIQLNAMGGELLTKILQLEELLPIEKTTHKNF